MDERTYYQNFKLGTELDISGEFIYNGLSSIYSMSYFDENAPTFCALYNVSVGIERLQKVVYGLWGLSSKKSNEDFENSIRNHSHVGLHAAIKKVVTNDSLVLKLDFSNRENDFLTLLQSFYNSLRYERFNIVNQKGNEKKLLFDYIEKYADIPEGIDDVIVINDRTKKILGRIVGRIVRTYYTLVEFRAHELNIYTYELRSNSKAAKIFLTASESSDYLSYQNQVTKLAVKELLAYIRNSNEKTAFFDYFDSISPIELDPANINAYIGEIIEGEVPQELVDYVEDLYAEMDDSKERKELVNLLGNTNVLYDYQYLCECRELVIDAISKNKELNLNSFIERLNMIDDEILVEDINNITNEYARHVRNRDKKNMRLCLDEILELIPELTEEKERFT